MNGRKRRGAPPPAEILRHLSYCRETGTFTRIAHRCSTLVGTRADRPMINGYRKVVFLGREYSAHSLAWFFAYREWPELDIDHRDLNPQNNSILNLRLATVAQNVTNRRPFGSFEKGVAFRKQNGKFMAQIGHNKSNLYLGSFDTEAEAHGAYCAAATRLYGEFARFS